MTKPWGQMQNVILDYYQKQGLPLKQVMEIMKENHSFTASQRAYRQQFQKWAVFKYNRKSKGHPAAQQLQVSHSHSYARPGTPAGYSSGHRSGRMFYQDAYSPRGPAYTPNPNQMSLQLPLPLPLSKPENTNQHSEAHYMPHSAAHLDQPLDTKQAYPPLQTSPQQPHQNVSYSHAYYDQVSSPVSDRTDRYRSYNSSFCSHQQSSMDQGSHSGSVPLAHSDSRSSFRSSFPPTPPYSHHNSFSASSPSPRGIHDSLSQGALASHTAALPHHSHAHLPALYPQVYTQAISVT